MIEDSEHIFCIDSFNRDRLNLQDCGMDILDPKKHLDSLRVIKSEAEIELMRKSAELASDAHILAMRAKTRCWRMASSVNNRIMLFQTVLNGHILRL